MNSNARLFLILSGLNVCWGAVNLAVTAAQNTMSTSALLLTRWGIFCVLAWVGIAFRPAREFLRVKLPEGSDRAKAMLIGFCLFAPSHALYYHGLESTATGEAMVLNTSGPLWIGLLAFLILREKVTWARWVAILIGATGSYVVTMGFATPNLQSSHTVGNMFYLAGVIVESLAMILAIKIIRKSSGPGTLAFELIGVALSCLVMPLIVPQMALKWAVPDVWTIVSIAYLVLIAGLFCFGTWYRSVEKAPISLMVISLGIQAPLGVLLGHFVRREALTVNVGIGSALILCALVIASRESQTPPQPESMLA